MARHGGLKLLALRVEDVDVAVFVANRKDVAIWSVAQAEDRAVNPQGRLAYEVASRPLLAEYLHAVAAVIEIIARCGEFVATWGPTDALDLAVDVQ